MRVLQTFLLAAGLFAAPASSVAGPSDQPSTDSWSVEKFERSTSKGKLGVMVMGLTDELQTHLGSTDKTGVLVARVEPRSPAARAGIAVGDVIVEVRGRAIDNAGDVIAALADVGKNEHASVKIVRDKKLMSLDVRFTNDMTSTLDAWPGLKWLRDMFELGAPMRSSST
jgi:S1-C subfamily serine protease